MVPVDDPFGRSCADRASVVRRRGGEAMTPAGEGARRSMAYLVVAACAIVAGCSCGGHHAFNFAAIRAIRASGEQPDRGGVDAVGTNPVETAWCGVPTGRMIERREGLGFGVVMREIRVARGASIKLEDLRVRDVVPIAGDDWVETGSTFVLVPDDVRFERDWWESSFSSTPRIWMGLARRQDGVVVLVAHSGSVQVALAARETAGSTRSSTK